MSVWKKTMFYLGLGPDEDYAGAPPPETDALGHDDRVAPGSGPLAAPDDGRGEPSAVRALGPMEEKPEKRMAAVGGSKGPATTPNGGSRTANNLSSTGSAGTPRANASSSSSTSGINTVRPLPASNVSATKPHIVSPRAFNDAQEVADRFRGGLPVIMNLQQVERDLSRRLIDFASGMCYGLSGQMEKVGEKVYLLTPADVELSPEDRRELHEQGLHSG